MLRIGYDCPVTIIAEAGINHNGNLSIAKDMALAAKMAGADAVKYQTFKPEELVVPYRNITYDQTILLKEYCDEIDIEFLSTPHSYSAIDFLEPLVPMYKVASPRLYDYKFMEKVFDKGKPVIVSVNEKARHDNIAWLMDRDCYILHTVCRYPAPSPMFIHLATRQEYYWQKPWGYSDHCVGYQACIEAYDVFQVAVIEKHFRLQMECPDAIHSINAKEFKKMVDKIRKMEATPVKASSPD
jgi:N,N'-diacetyllegionaminate synthase